MAQPLVPAVEVPWTIRDAEKLYNMPGWGLGYFRINDSGHVTLHPDGEDGEGIDLHHVAMDLDAQGVGLPLLLRFSDILRSRLAALAEHFRTAIEEFEYESSYTTVYPVKVNQQRHVIQEIVEFGAKYGVGLECGSKPELMAVLGLHESTSHLIICNGYKDEEFMRLALIGQRLGHRMVIVLEQLSELDVLFKVAEEMGVEPTLGVRIKLASEGSGRWAKSGGEKSKFGLSPIELIRLLDRLKAEGRQSLLKLIHFHLGSQITDIRHIKAGLEEVARYYVELHKLGFPVEYVDVGGGMGVDYDGSRSTRSASMNYTMREYANDVVYTIGGICREEGVPMPALISESGRAITAHHALLLVNVINCESQFEPQPVTVNDDSQQLIVDLHENLESLTEDRIEEVFHDAVFAKERAQEYFGSGLYSLQERADVEQLYLTTLNALAAVMNDDVASYPEIAAHIEATLVDRYFCNFSIFQSVPDNWAIDQLFPIIPIHRLNERPTRRGTLQDVTCDSDGKIDRFVGARKGKPSLELHPWRENESYILGIFLTGAYQETLGDLHNLFGDTNVVHIRSRDGGGYEVSDLVHGDTVTEVLNYVQFNSSDLLTTFRRKVARVKGLNRHEANGFIADYVAGLEGYTYLEGDLPE